MFRHWIRFASTKASKPAPSKAPKVAAPTEPAETETTPLQQHVKLMNASLDYAQATLPPSIRALYHLKHGVTRTRDPLTEPLSSLQQDWMRSQMHRHQTHHYARLTRALIGKAVTLRTPTNGSGATRSWLSSSGMMGAYLQTKVARGNHLTLRGLQQKSRSEKAASEKLLQDAIRLAPSMYQRGVDRRWATRLLDVLRQENPIWRSWRLQAPIVRAYAYQTRRLAHRLARAVRMSPFQAESALSVPTLTRRLEHHTLATQLMQQGPIAESDVYPLTGREADMPHQSHRLMGLDLRIAGPRRGDRAVKFVGSCGRLRQSASVIRETAVVHLPTKVGTFGVRIRMAFGHRKQLCIDPQMRCEIGGEKPFILSPQSFQLAYTA